MTPSRDHRRDFLFILAIAVGAFLGLSLLPLTVTGPLGRFGGGVLWRTLGAGAVMAPLGLIGYGAAGLKGAEEGDTRRLLVFGATLVLIVPYWLGVFGGVRTVEGQPADYADWPARLQVVGLLPAFLLVGVVSVIGTAGAVLLGVVGTASATMFTIGWEPFMRVVDRLREARTRARYAAATPLDPDSSPTDPSIPPPQREVRAPVFRARRGKPNKAPPPPPSVDAVEQAFADGDAIARFPGDYLREPPPTDAAADSAELDRMGDVLIDTLKTFRVEATLGPHRATGPVVTQFEVEPAAGVKVNKIAGLADDLALKMAAQSVRIAPIPGRSFVGVEVPNPTPRIVTLQELLSPPHWDPERAGLPIALGQDLEGRPVMADLTRMPHLLIAGATGSGKSVCINTIVTSLIYRYTERELQMLMIDPKMVELTTYNALPHLISPVVTNNKDAAKTLKWAMYEMEDRYALFSVNNVRNLHEFNRKVRDGKRVVEPVPEKERDAEAEYQRVNKTPVRDYSGSTKPFLVVIVDELADLMMTVQGEVEKPLAILAQKARATGIHLVLATQRPSVNVITGLIKANFPSRIAFRVASKVDSRTILDQNGAETLLGNGDMLFLPPGKSEPIRVQGAFISTEETEQITGWYHLQLERAAQEGVPIDSWRQDILAIVRERELDEEGGEAQPSGEPADRDALFLEAAETCIQQQLGSTSLLQRKLRIGYGRAARIIDQLYEAGILGPPDGSKPREVLIGAHQLDEYT